jgi:hypothetical protein
VPLGQVAPEAPAGLAVTVFIGANHSYTFTDAAPR